MRPYARRPIGLSFLIPIPIPTSMLKCVGRTVRGSSSPVPRTILCRPSSRLEYSTSTHRMVSYSVRILAICSRCPSALSDRVPALLASIWEDSE